MVVSSSVAVAALKDLKIKLCKVKSKMQQNFKNEYISKSNKTLTKYEYLKLIENWITMYSTSTIDKLMENSFK